MSVPTVVGCLLFGGQEFFIIIDPNGLLILHLCRENTAYDAIL
jgi:hypothetical protein